MSCWRPAASTRSLDRRRVGWLGRVPDVLRRDAVDGDPLALADLEWVVAVVAADLLAADLSRTPALRGGGQHHCPGQADGADRHQAAEEEHRGHAARHAAASGRHRVVGPERYGGSTPHKPEGDQDDRDRERPAQQSLLGVVAATR